MIGLDRNTSREAWEHAWAATRTMARHMDTEQYHRWVTSAASDAELCAHYRLMDRERVEIHGVERIRCNQIADEILDEILGG